MICLSSTPDLIPLATAVHSPLAPYAPRNAALHKSRTLFFASLSIDGSCCSSTTTRPSPDSLEPNSQRFDLGDITGRRQPESTPFASCLGTPMWSRCRPLGTPFSNTPFLMPKPNHGGMNPSGQASPAPRELAIIAVLDMAGHARTWNWKQPAMLDGRGPTSRPRAMI